MDHKCHVDSASGHHHAAHCQINCSRRRNPTANVWRCTDAHQCTGYTWGFNYLITVNNHCFCIFSYNISFLHNSYIISYNIRKLDIHGTETEILCANLAQHITDILKNGQGKKTQNDDSTVSMSVCTVTSVWEWQPLCAGRDVWVRLGEAFKNEIMVEASIWYFHEKKWAAGRLVLLVWTWPEVERREGE